MIIDTHTHIGVLPPFYMTADMLLGSMERYGIDFSLVSNIEGAENDHRGDPVPPKNGRRRKTSCCAARWRSQGRHRKSSAFCRGCGSGRSCPTTNLCAS